ncbi:MAG: hypothetical protein H6702_11200 [Myxococcales bacterium]|nr:hypothetical protein [Myxococcales bacterium]
MRAALWALAAVALWAGGAQAQVAHDLAVTRVSSRMTEAPLALPDSDALLTVDGYVTAPEWAGDGRAPAVTVELQVGSRGRDLQGNVVVLGAVAVARLSVRWDALVPDPRNPRPAPSARFQVPFSDGPLRAWASAHQGDTWMVQVVVDPDRAIDEGRDRAALLNNTAFIEAGGSFRPVSGQGTLGAVTVTYVDPSGIGPAGACPDADVRVDPEAAGLIWAPAAGGPWSGTLSAGLCMDWALGGNGVDYDLAAAVGPPAAAVASAEIGGVTVRMAGALGGQGFTPALVGVAAANTTTHAQELVGVAERPRPAGLPGVFIAPNPAPIADFASIRLRPSQPLWVNPGELPFSLRMAALQIDPDQVTFSWDRAWSHLDRVRDPQDPRGRTTRLWSNDARFTRVGGGPGVAQVGPDGITTTVQVGAASTGLHFPRVEVTWQGQALQVQASGLVRGAVASGDGTRVAFAQREDCPSCAEASGNRQAHAADSQGPLLQDGDGTVMARVVLDPEVSDRVRWGGDAGGRRTFERDQDHGRPLVFVAPGFRATGTGATGDVAAWLQGAWAAEVGEADAPRPGAVYPLGSAQRARGNHFMAGLTAGPQIYRDGQGQPQEGLGASLAGTQTQVGFGGPEQPLFTAVDANPGTKYVLRPGGVTGVFNTDQPPLADVYGYAFAFDRFGFRQVSNRVDPYSWIDGQVRVEGRADFGVAFTALTLECSGQIGSGQMVPSDCRADPPVNCDQRLRAWKAPYEVGSFSFVPPEGEGQCFAGPRALFTDGTVQVQALDEKLDLSARWAPDGSATDATVGGRTANAFDRRGGEAFRVRLDEAIELAPAQGGLDEGWFAMTGRLPLPFWDAPRAAFRFENGAAGPAQTLVARPDALPANWATGALAAVAERLEVEPQALRAHYRWGSTPFELDLPVRFALGRAAGGQPPQLVGLPRRDFDLVVMRAYAGTQRITPNTTTVVFGASADFDKVLQTDVDLHLDLNDPESVARADAFLARFLPGNGPWIGPVVNTVRHYLSLTRRITGSGFNAFLEQQVRAGIDALVRPVYGQLARAIRQLQALPAQVGQIGVSEVRRQVQRLLDPLRQFIDQHMQQFYLTWPGLVLEARVAIQANVGIPAQTLQGLQVNLDRLRDTLNAFDQLDQGLDAVDQRLVALAGQLDGTLQQGQQRAQQALAALDAALLLLDPGSGLRLAECAPNLPNEHLFMAAFDEARDAVAQAINAIQGNQVVQVAVAVASLVGVNQSTVQRAEAEIRAKAEEVADQFDAAVDDVTAEFGVVCPLLQDTLSEHRAELQAVRDAVAALDAAGALQTLRDQLAGASDRARTFVDRTRGYLAVIRGTLRELIDDTEALINGELPARLDVPNVQILQVNLQTRFRVISPLFIWYAPDVGGQAMSFVNLFEQLVIESFEGFIAELVAIPNQALAQLNRQLSFPTEDELVERLVTAIMGSEAARAVDEAVHTALTTVLGRLDVLGNRLFDTVNELLQAALARLESAIEEALAAANSVLKAIPISSAKVDGLATIRGNQLELLHVGAEWTMKGDGADDSTTYKAALDISRWTANGKGANCVEGTAAAGYIDALISGYDLPLTVSGSDLTLKRVTLGFTLRDLPNLGLAPIGILGAIETVGVIDFKTFELFDLGLAVGAGAEETYVGATGGARFSGTQIEAAFLAGRTCDPAIIELLDPQVASFLELSGPFVGAYARGSASIPVWNNGCALTVGVGADAGAWVLQGPRVGGLVGGSLWGEALCIAALRGSLTALADYNDGQFSFRGEGFAVAGLGFDCDPHTWTSVPRSRRDSWCGTGDAQFQATYRNGWDLGTPSTSAIH